jgi:hypothetical protein
MTALHFRIVLLPPPAADYRPHTTSKVLGVVGGELEIRLFHDVRWMLCSANHSARFTELPGNREFPDCANYLVDILINARSVDKQQPISLR